MSDILINRVSNSGIITINPEHYYPSDEIVGFDLKDYLFMEMVLKEKDFRNALQSHDWGQYDGKILCIYCTVDAIIPVWAYMLVSVYAQSHAVRTYVGDKAAYLTHYYDQVLSQMDMEDYRDKKIVIKGCGDKMVPPGVYETLARLLKPVAGSIMYGEPCSTVPVYKKR